MEDNMRYIEKQIDKNRIEAQAVRRQAVAERNQADRYTEGGQESQRDGHSQQAILFDVKAEQLEDEADALEPKKAEIEARINELKTERETINRETVDRTLAIDKELARLGGRMTF
jgi:vacuolar-type H+-ATPase subunit I/STV1